MNGAFNGSLPDTSPDTSISGRRVAREVTTRLECRGKPGMIVSDNGAEPTSNAILKGGAKQKVEWPDIAPAARQWFARKP